MDLPKKYGKVEGKMSVSLDELIRCNLQPVLLGDCRRARKCARSFYIRYGTVSYICDEKTAPLHFFGSSSRFFRLYGVSHPDLVSCQLSYLATSDADCLYVLIPCTEAFSVLLSENAALFEGNFVIADLSDFHDKIPALRRITI